MEIPRFVPHLSNLMSSSLIVYDMTSTPEENTSVRGIYAFTDFSVKTSLFCAILYSICSIYL